MGRPRIRPPTVPSSSGATAIRDRIRTLVTDSYGGNVRQAAAAIGLAQPTLWRLLEGRAARLEALQAIAGHFGCGVEWIIDGRGQAPAGPPADAPRGSQEATAARRTGERLRWMHALRDLQAYGLSEAGVGTLAAWPHHEPFSAAVALFDPSLLNADSAIPLERREQLDRALDDWLRAHYAAASVFVAQLIDVFGPESVAARLEVLYPTAALGFDHARTERLRGGPTPEDPDAVAAWLLAAKGQLAEPLPVARTRPPKGGVVRPEAKRRRVASARKPRR